MESVSERRDIHRGLPLVRIDDVDTLPVPGLHVDGAWAVSVVAGDDQPPAIGGEPGRVVERLLYASGLNRYWEPVPTPGGHIGKVVSRVSTQLERESATIFPPGDGDPTDIVGQHLHDQRGEVAETNDRDALTGLHAGPANDVYGARERLAENQHVSEARRQHHQVRRIRQRSFSETVPRQARDRISNPEIRHVRSRGIDLPKDFVTGGSGGQWIFDSGDTPPRIQIRTADTASAHLKNNLARPRRGIVGVDDAGLPRSAKRQRTHAARVLHVASRFERSTTLVKFVIFGLTISSAWANGHATPLRALLRGLHQLGHCATFFERDVAYYAKHRDLVAPDFCNLELYSDWSQVLPRARAALREADVAIVTSYCPDGLAACREVLDTARVRHVFYDMDTPITVEALDRDGLAISSGAHYLTTELVPEFDLYLSFTGGPLLDCLNRRWRARRTAALYGSVDPDSYKQVAAPPVDWQCDLGYLGTFAADRQPMLESLLLEPARQRPFHRFLVAGSLYPPDVEWPPNVGRIEHVEPRNHPSFYSANRLTLSVSRAAMREWGYTPSGRLFEASSCGAPLLTDSFPGVEQFFSPGEEVLLADTTEAATAALDLSHSELVRIGAAGRERTLTHHTGLCRARELVHRCEAVPC